MDHTNGIFSKIGKVLYLSDETADVNFIFEPDPTQIEVVPAHKSHLAAASTAFRMMFKKCDEVDDNAQGKSCIVMCDVTPGAFKEFLKFFYFSEVKISMENVAEVMELGFKFNVDTMSNFKFN